MRKTLTEQLCDLGLTEKDFKFEIVEFGEPSYPYGGFNPERTMYAKVNGILCKVRTKVNIEAVKDIEVMTGLNGMKEVEKVLKEEAINWYINNNQFIRKQKLLKIKEKYGI